MKCANASRVIARIVRLNGKPSKSRLTCREQSAKRPIEATLLIDCATLWISNLMWEFREESAAEQNRLILAEIDNLIDAVRLRAENSIGTGDRGRSDHRQQ